MRSNLLAGFVITAALGVSTVSQAENVIGIREGAASTVEQYKAALNSNTITIIGSRLTGGNLKLVDDIAKAVNDGTNLRVLPIIGEGSSQNICDVLYLKGVDVGTVKLGSIESYEKDPLFANLRNRLQYIAALSGQEFHIVGRRSITSLQDLAGKWVGGHGGAFVAVQDLLNKLKIRLGEVVDLDFYKGLEQIKNDQLDAIARLTASPMKDFNEKVDLKYHRIIPVPFHEALIQDYIPGKLTHKVYPDLIAEGEVIETVASPAALVAYAWSPDSERYRRVAKFTEAFFSNFSKLLADKERHPSWDSVNLAAELPGWKRFPAAQEWLEKNKYITPKAAGERQKPNNEVPTAALINPENQSLEAEFQNYLKKRNIAPSSKEQIMEAFHAFIEWRKRSGGNSRDSTTSR